MGKAIDGRDVGRAEMKIRWKIEGRIGNRKYQSEEEEEGERGGIVCFWDIQTTERVWLNR